MAKILFVRSTPYDEDLNGYNVQGAGIAKAFCKLGYETSINLGMLSSNY